MQVLSIWKSVRGVKEVSKVLIPNWGLYSQVRSYDSSKSGLDPVDCKYGWLLEHL